ncbi:dihydrolipoamide acetyltransferase family protein [Vreelandella titanicae]|uniref:Dihydrolipoamide acetyltransferase component of pyruvate dehydrogenase complex n=1 Tax=Vreelandella titanicae TaxID=664683 RepID=A0AAP9T3J5_9GAMM|nr:dihydrolipoamide acetyltransferase family protein [Halomonas titanicae]QKS26751.1 Dihydrolipoyllysine-residue succinyltransferase component of 2-oxoglutarate dehydrogenase complex [Halomonas titanicae]
MSNMNELLMPKLGLTMTEGTLAEWSISPGDSVRPGDIMFVVETDKVATEVTAEAEGELREILVQEGETVPVGTVVGYWTGPGQSPRDSDEPVQESNDEKGNDDRQESQATPSSSMPESLSSSEEPSSRRVIATPLARRLAREHGVDLEQVHPSGGTVRVKANDIRAAVHQQQSKLSHPESVETQSLEPRESQSIPASAHLQAMARRMVESKQQVPHFYLAAEAEITELLTLRNVLNQQEGYEKLSLNHLVVAAVVRALERSPEQNRIFINNSIVEFEHIDVGMAVSTERGLFAPVLKHMEGMALDDIANKARALQDRVQTNSLSHDDMHGGAITVSNGGMFNVSYMTPIINSPQSAILGVGSIRELFRPDAQGQPALRREIGLVLAADHRLHDGAGALAFLNRIVDALQQPYQLLRPRVAARRG